MICWPCLLLIFAINDQQSMRQRPVQANSGTQRLYMGLLGVSLAFVSKITNRCSTLDTEARAEPG